MTTFSSVQFGCSFTKVCQLIFLLVVVRHTSKKRQQTSFNQKNRKQKKLFAGAQTTKSPTSVNVHNGSQLLDVGHQKSIKQHLVTILQLTQEGISVQIGAQRIETPSQTCHLHIWILDGRWQQVSQEQAISLRLREGRTSVQQRIQQQVLTDLCREDHITLEVVLITVTQVGQGGGVGVEEAMVVAMANVVVAVVSECRDSSSLHHFGAL